MRKTEKIKIPIRYLPSNLSDSDKIKQKEMLMKSRRLYKKDKYFTRRTVKSYKSKESKHIKHARKIYNVENIEPSKELSDATGCSIESLQKIVNKGEGAYFSSGSRPNQRPQSWGYARLASAITGQKAAAVDFNILDSGCNHKKKAYTLAKKSVKQFKHGQSKTRKVIV